MLRRGYLAGVGGLAASLPGCPGRQMGGSMDVVMTNRRDSPVGGTLTVSRPDWSSEGDRRNFDLDSGGSVRYDELVHVPDHSVEYELTVSLDDGNRHSETLPVGTAGEGEFLIDVYEERITVDDNYPD